MATVRKTGCMSAGGRRHMHACYAHLDPFLPNPVPAHCGLHVAIEREEVALLQLLLGLPPDHEGGDPEEPEA